MRCGLTNLPEHPKGPGGSDMASGEELGFKHAWPYGYLFWGELPDSPYGTTPTLTAAAMVTSTIQLGAFVASPSCRSSLAGHRGHELHGVAGESLSWVFAVGPMANLLEEKGVDRFGWSGTSTTETRSSDAHGKACVAGVDMNLEVVVIRVSDVERVTQFDDSLGWRLDVDRAPADDFRPILFRPPGSGCSVQFGNNVTSAAAGSAQGLHLIVSDIESTR
jgi:hypothetical protein